jgi:hypothetical protein
MNDLKVRIPKELNRFTETLTLALEQTKTTLQRNRFAHTLYILTALLTWTLATHNIKPCRTPEPIFPDDPDELTNRTSTKNLQTLIETLLDLEATLTNLLTIQTTLTMAIQILALYLLGNIPDPAHSETPRL